MALRWACLDRHDGNLNSDCSDRSKVCTSLAGPEALESLSFCGELLLWSCFSGFSLVSHTAREAPLQRAGLLSTVVIGYLRNPAEEMPSARRKAFLLTFVAAWTKVRRLAGRTPPVLLLLLIS